LLDPGPIIISGDGANGASSGATDWAGGSTFHAEFIVTECAMGELAATLSRISHEGDRYRRFVQRSRTRGPLLREFRRDAADPRLVRQPDRPSGGCAITLRWRPGRPQRHVALEATAAAPRDYIDRTQLGKTQPLSPPSREAAGTTMAIDPATRANLELTRTLGGERRGSLLDAIDAA